jgi:transcriptional regulator with GAF, ATPase, and Fis domain
MLRPAPSPLRERDGDVRLLAEGFLATLRERHGCGPASL